MPTRIKCENGTLWIDERPTLNEWVKQVGGQFAKLEELKKVNGVPSAFIKTDHSWDPVRFDLPDHVLMTMRQCYQADI